MLNKKKGNKGMILDEKMINDRTVMDDDEWMTMNAGMIESWRMVMMNNEWDEWDEWWWVMMILPEAMA